MKSSEDAVVDGIFKADDKYTNLCLSKEKGDPYLLKLESGPLNSEYLKDKASVPLKLIDRVDVGNTGAEIRYFSLFFIHVNNYRFDTHTHTHTYAHTYNVLHKRANDRHM